MIIKLRSCIYGLLPHPVNLSFKFPGIKPANFFVWFQGRFAKPDTIDLEINLEMPIDPQGGCGILLSADPPSLFLKRKAQIWRVFVFGKCQRFVIYVRIKAGFDGFVAGFFVAES